MKRTFSNLRFLWSTRNTSGFPWPFHYGVGSKRHRIRFALLGYPFYSPIPVWKQIVTIPFRPYRYIRMVCGIAYTRAINFNVSMYDDVP